jgi:hypothetical protein
MSEHTWVQENLASYVAGGLEAGERDRIEQHTATCATCARALAEARAMDADLDQLFAPVRPEAALEDRLVRALRATAVRSGRRSLWVRCALGAAAVLLLGLVGASASYIAERGGLPFPGSVGSADESRLLAAVRSFDSLSGVDQGGDSKDRFPHRPSSESVEGGERLHGLRDPERQRKLGESDSFGWSFRGRSGTPKNQGWGETTSARGDADEGRKTIRDGEKAKEKVAAAETDYQAAEKAKGEARARYETHLRLGNGRNLATSAEDMRAAKQLWDRATQEADAKKKALELAQAEKERLGSRDVEGGDKKASAQIYSYRDDRTAPIRDGLTATLGTSTGTPPASGPGGVNGPAAFGFHANADGRYFAQPLDPKSGYALETQKAEEGQGKGDQAKGEQNKPGRPSTAGSVAVGATVEDEPGAPGEKKPNQATPEPGPPRKVIIRSGDIEFEIESFDSAVATVTKLVANIKGGFVATVNSEKLPNGKVRGSMVVRVPPETLDGLVLDLRKELGKGSELKGQRIGSQDITKQYTDLESRLRAARAMEERLLNIIKTGKGEIKDLLQAEKELGVWRTKIEEIEGELRYYSNLVALSTLTITLTEKEIRAPYSIVETERIQMGLEVEEVDKALREAIAAVTHAKGRVTKSELKQHAAGQFTALLHFEVAPESAGPLRDRLKQLGNLARLEIDRVEQAEGGTGQAKDAKLKRNDSQFVVSLYNLATNAPREIVHINLASVDPEASYKTILARVEKAAGRVASSNLNRERSEQITGTIAFDVKTAEAEAVLADLKQAGEVLRLQVTESADGPNVTRSKRGFVVQLFALGQVEPRETTTITLATRDVPASYRALQEVVTKAKGRIIKADLSERDKKNITAKLDFDIRRVDEPAVLGTLGKSGAIHSRTVDRAKDSEQTLDSKVGYRVTMINAATIPPRKTFHLGIEVSQVEKTAASFAALVAENQGRVVDSKIHYRRNGQVVAPMTFDVPLSAGQNLVDKFKAAGTVRIQEVGEDPQLPEDELAIARIEVELANGELIVPSDEGIWPQIRTGLAYSVKVGALSLSWVIFGICVVLPWALIVYVAYRLLLRRRRRAGAGSVA